MLNKHNFLGSVCECMYSSLENIILLVINYRNKEETVGRVFDWGTHSAIEGCVPVAVVVSKACCIARLHHRACLATSGADLFGSYFMGDINNLTQSRWLCAVDDADVSF